MIELVIIFAFMGVGLLMAYVGGKHDWTDEHVNWYKEKGWL